MCEKQTPKLAYLYLGYSPIIFAFGLRKLVGTLTVNNGGVEPASALIKN